MSVDNLQEKIRKVKNPSVLELSVDPADIPAHILPDGSEAERVLHVCKDLLSGLKGLIPAVRFSFTAFALLEGQGLDALASSMKFASEQGYYVLLDAPQMLSPQTAAMTAARLLGERSRYSCDGLVIPGYLGSDIIKAFLPYCTKEKKDVFVVTRTANKSASELQDLIAGSRLVYMAAADHVNRYGADTAGKYGYTRVGVLAAASSSESVRTLRTKYPRLFLLVDGYDYPNANAKNCSYAFDKFGHGAAVCAGASIHSAWKQTESDGADYVACAVSAAERMKKNLTRYTTIL